ncbi:hypothetical protein ACFL6N_05225 [Thermodesulfobacteriota bacterium]
MKILLIISRSYVILIATAGFLFGQVFFGNLGLPALIASFCGIFSGIYSSTKYKHEKNIKTLLASFCLGGLFGVFMDAMGYYTTDQVPGNSYAWELLAPYCLALCIILYNAVFMNKTQQQEDIKSNNDK